MKPGEHLDYDIFEVAQNEWQVWTPDFGGACIGSGKTKLEAVTNASNTLIKTAENLLKEPL